MIVDPQLQSPFFGRLPREIRDIIYAKLWEVSGTVQHVFECDGVITHCPCILMPGEEDTLNKEFELVWNELQLQQTYPMVHDGKWARRMESSWHDHWKCEEAMLQETADDRRASTPFLSSLLACRRMYQEALPSLYKSTTLSFTSLSLAHRLLTSSVSPYISLLRSLRLSLSVPYTTLHHHKYVTAPPGHLMWVELCTTLSNLFQSAALREVVLRLEMTDDDRFWWEVHETWAMSAVSGTLRRGMVLQLPEITADVPRMRGYQFASDTDGAHTPHPPASDNTSTTLARPWKLERGAAGPEPAKRSPSPSDQHRVRPDFKKLERYPRRRWTRDGGSNGVRARLEFFNPEEHVPMAPETRMVNMRGLFRGMLIY